MGKQARRRAGISAETGRGRKHRDVFVARPFAGLATETEWVAMRELVPAGTASVQLADPAHRDREVTIATVLPMAYPALVKADGRIFLSVQANARSGDLSRDLAAVLETALHTDPGRYVTVSGLPDPGPRLQDLLADNGELSLQMYESFSFWLDDQKAGEPEVAASLEQANKSIVPTVRMASAPSAYWCQVPDRAHLRWVLPDGEEEALSALSRLSAGGLLTLGNQTRYAGAFRAHGLLVPVWDLPRELEAGAWEDGLAALTKHYADAIADTSPLTSTERQARSTLQARQLTLR